MKTFQTLFARYYIIWQCIVFSEISDPIRLFWRFWPDSYEEIETGFSKDHLWKCQISPKSQFYLFCEEEELGIFWWLNGHDRVFTHFSLKFRIFSNTLSVLEYLSTFEAVCKISESGDLPTGQDLQKSAEKTHFLKIVWESCWGPTLITICKKTMTQILDHVTTPGNYRKVVFWWYRLQNSRTVRYIDLKFDMGVVFENLEDVIHVFLPGTVHK